MWSIISYMTRRILIQLLSWKVATVHWHPGFLSLFVCAWLMFLSVLARRSQHLAPVDLQRVFFRLSFMLLRYLCIFSIIIRWKVRVGVLVIDFFPLHFRLFHEIGIAVNSLKWSQRLEQHASKSYFLQFIILDWQFFRMLLCFSKSPWECSEMSQIRYIIEVS